MNASRDRTFLDCEWLLANPGTEPPQRGMRIVLEGERIASVEATEAVPAGRRLALPALTNAHDHGRYFRSGSIGAFEQPLESWLPFVGVIPGADPYLNAAATFARSVRHGVANLMMHYTRVQGGTSYVDEVRTIARASRDVGNRIGFAVSMRDRHPLGYADNATVLAALSPEIRDAVATRLGGPLAAFVQQMALVDEVAAMIEDEGYSSHATVQYGPNGVQWCSTAMLEAIASASADTGRPVHMHLLETRYQREWADREHPGGIVRFLDSIGLLSPRLTLAHCVWAREDELQLLAERGVTLAVNTSSNLYLKSGIAPVPAMLGHGCRIALGLDATGVDEDDDPLREMRLAYQLHRGWGFDVTMDRAQLWQFAGRNGARTVRGATAAGPEAGVIAVGAEADLLILDYARLDDDALLPVDPLDLVLARGSGAYVDAVYVGGRRVVAEGRVTGVDEPGVRAELTGQMRAKIAAEPEVAAWYRTVQAMAKDLGPFYLKGAWRGCC